MINNLWPSRLANNRFLILFLVLLTASLIWVTQTALAADNSTIPDSLRVSSDAGDSPNMKDCSNTSTGMIPLIDLEHGSYQGFPGGLYPDGNDMPDSHLHMGMAANQAVEPLSPQGQPDNSGKILFLSVGMSNTKQEFKQFMKIARGQMDRRVSLINGAQGGYDAATIADSTSDYWNKIDAQLDRRNLSPLQVQVIWLLEAVAHETDVFPQDAQELQSYLRDIVLIIENRYPNVKAIYFSSRAYGGYSGPSSPSPEAWAYQGGFSTKWLIESQINGSDAAMAYNNTPWLAWGPYTWADGMNPRSDGLTWSCDDFEADGVHPSLSGELKVANMLLGFFNEDSMTQWFPNSRLTETFGTFEQSVSLNR